MKPIITWILLADLASARILEYSDAEERLIQRPDNVFKATETLPYSDDEGRTMAGATSARVRLDKHLEYTSESDAFARNLINVLTKGLRDKAYHQLIICAGPSMLGLLRNRMSEELAEVIRAEIAKDLVNTPNDKVYSHLKDVIRQ